MVRGIGAVRCLPLSLHGVWIAAWVLSKACTCVCVCVCVYVYVYIYICLLNKFHSRFFSLFEYFSVCVFALCLSVFFSVCVVFMCM